VAAPPRPPRFIAPQQAIPRNPQPRIVPNVQQVQPRIFPGPNAPAARRTVRSAPPAFTPRGNNTVTAARLRGLPPRSVGRAFIRGQNFSAWRGPYRVSRGGGFRTFVALSALGIIAIEGRNYYPYAYISAPGPYCEGLTEDGCELVFQEVETLEGDELDQCVAYCPWQ
jgi:hypothetical protein